MAGQKRLFNYLAQFLDPQFLVESGIRTPVDYCRACCA